jgi:hypothetical protein
VGDSGPRDASPGLQNGTHSAPRLRVLASPRLRVLASPRPRVILLTFEVLIVNFLTRRFQEQALLSTSDRTVGRFDIIHIDGN